MTLFESPTPVLVDLQEVLSQGRELAVRPNLSIGASQLWIMRARAGLSRRTVIDAPQVDRWCPRHNT